MRDKGYLVLLSKDFNRPRSGSLSGTYFCKVYEKAH